MIKLRWANECEWGDVRAGGYCESCGKQSYEWLSFSDGCTWWCEDCFGLSLIDEQQEELSNAIKRIYRSKEYQEHVQKRISFML